MADLIDRGEAIKAIEDLQDCYNGFSDSYDKACIIGVLQELPSAERCGKWMDATTEIGFPKWECSICGADGRGDYQFCPFCGAKMEAEK